MRATSPSAFLLSATLHGVFAALVLYFTYGLRDQIKEAPTIFELVAGEGDNYLATEAPALGTPGGITVAIPELPAARPSPPEPVIVAAPPPEPVIERAPVTKAAAPPEEIKIRDFSKDVKRISTKRQQRLEAEDRRRREIAERKAKQDADRKAKEEALKSQRMSKAEFDRLNKNKKSPAAPAGRSSVKVARIDAEGIAKGVIGGSTANKVGGAGGTALTRSEGDAIDAYTALLARKIKTELDEKPGVGAGLIVEVEVRILSDGTLTGFRITQSSGSTDFDRAVREAFANMKMPPRPKGMSELQRFPIRGVE